MEVDPVFNEDQEGLDEDVPNLDIYIQKKNLFSANSNLFEVPRYEKKGGTFTTGINIFSKEEQKKMDERAKRFGLTNTPKPMDVEDEEELYSSMGVLDDNENAKYIRLNVLHMRGTDDMSTQDVFDYFKDYAPASIEWINDVSCNVVWLDKISAARALIGLSKKIVGLNDKGEVVKLQSEESSLDNDNKLIDVEESNYMGENDKETTQNTINLKDIDFPLPPGVWRKGLNCEKSQKILLRFAMSSDKKQPNAEKLSEYYKKYGNPNFGGMRGILTDSKKRMYRDIKIKRKPLNKMDEDNGVNSKNPWGSLSEAWGANDSVEEDFIKQSRLKDHQAAAIEPRGIKRRLGIKPQIKEADEELKDSESSSDNDDEWNKRSKVLRMRMHADDEEEKMQKKKLKQLSKTIQEKMSNRDLRSRLGRANPIVYAEPIKVTVTNIPERLREPVKIKDEEDEVEVDIKDVQEIVHENDEEKEEGEWEDDEDEVENVRDTTDQEEDEEDEEEEESDSDSNMSEKEVQGPRGSVIKVVQRAKPRVASTVWARLNHNTENSFTQERKNSRSTISGDLRSRLGYHNRGRSPLRIEVKNDKYTKKNSESE